MAKRTKNPITLDEIIDAFIFSEPTLKMEDIKDYVLRQRGNSFYDYDSQYSFEQTIQAKVQSHCPDGYGYKGNAIFQLVSKGHYKLYDHEIYARRRIKNTDDIIINLTISNTVEDLELTARKLREVNSINRNKTLVVGLKKLYNNQCQLCGTKLKISDTNSYSEVHHIKPLGQPHNGPDTSSNMMVVCPNCHVQLDFRNIKISKEKLTFKIPHSIDDKNIEYHNSS